MPLPCPNPFPDKPRPKSSGDGETQTLKKAPHTEAPVQRLQTACQDPFWFETRWIDAGLAIQTGPLRDRFRELSHSGKSACINRFFRYVIEVEDPGHKRAQDRARDRLRDGKHVDEGYRVFRLKTNAPDAFTELCQSIQRIRTDRLQKVPDAERQLYASYLKPENPPIRSCPLLPDAREGLASDWRAFPELLGQFFLYLQNDEQPTWLKRFARSCDRFWRIKNKLTPARWNLIKKLYWWASGITIERHHTPTKRELERYTQRHGSSVQAWFHLNRKVQIHIYLDNLRYDIEREIAKG